MLREVRLGLLAILTIAIAIWGYKFVKGKNIFKSTKTFYAVFDNVAQLTVASPVLINGYNIGAVSSITLNPKDTKSILVSIEVDGNINYPKDTKAVLESAGVVGGKMISIEFDAPCSGNNCAQTGDYLEAQSAGLIESLLGDSDLSEYSGTLKETAGGVMDTINAVLSDKDNPSPINQSLWRMQESMENLSDLTNTMNSLMTTSYKDISATMSNMAILSNSLAESNEQIKSLLTNLDAISGEMRQVQLTPTLDAANDALFKATDLMGGLDSTLLTTNATFEELTSLIASMNEGDGMLPKLINDKTFSDNIELSTTNLNLLLQDLRLNPRRYFKVFGKKVPDYELPENDPANEILEKAVKEN